MRLMGLILLLFASPTWALSNAWQSASVPGVDRAWVKNSNAGEMLTVVTNQSQVPMELNGLTPLQIVSGVYLMRQWAFEKLGYTDLKMHTFRHEKSAGQDVLIIGGSYRRPDQEVMQFHERQIFRGRSFRQFSYMRRSGQVIKDQRAIEAMLLELSRDSRYPAEETMEAVGVCPNCLAPSTKAVEIPDPIPLSAVEKKEEAPACQTKGFLINPAAKSILQDFGLDYQGGDPFIVAGRSALTCVYGTGAGVVGSLKDLVMLLPNVFDLSYRGLKKAKGAIQEYDYSSLAEKFKPQNIWDSAKKGYRVTRDSVNKAYDGASEFMFESYKQGGVTGAIAAVGQAAYEASPHRAIGRYLADVMTKVAQAIGKEWKAFTCLPVEKMTETVCKVMGYLGTDIVMGKMILSGIEKSGRFMDVMRTVRAEMERLPIVGDWMIKNLKRTDDVHCGKVPETGWMTESRVNLQKKNVEVAMVGDTLLARGIDPKTKAMGCFTMVGEAAAATLTRIKETKKASEASGGASVAGEADFFARTNPNIARTGSDYVQTTNDKVGISISEKQSAKVASTLEADSVATKEYGEVLRSMDDLKAKSTGPKGELTPEGKVVMSQARDTVKALNHSLAKQEGAAPLQVSVVREAFQDALATQKADNLVNVERAVTDLNKAYEKTGDMGKAFTKWEEQTLKDRPHVTKEHMDQLRECFVKGSR